MSVVIIAVIINHILRLYAPNPVSAGATPQTPPGEVTAPQTLYSWI